MKSIGLVVAAVALAACAKEVETESGGSVDTVRDTVTRIVIPEIDVGTKRDTLTLPTLDKRGDTLIMGRKKVEVTRPTVDVNKKP